MVNLGDLRRQAEKSGWEMFNGGRWDSVVAFSSMERAKVWDLGVGLDLDLGVSLDLDLDLKVDDVDGDLMIFGCSLAVVGLRIGVFDRSQNHA